MIVSLFPWIYPSIFLDVSLSSCIPRLLWGSGIVLWCLALREVLSGDSLVFRLPTPFRLPVSSQVLLVGVEWQLLVLRPLLQAFYDLHRFRDETSSFEPKRIK